MDNTDTVFVIVSDRNYHSRAHQTITDLRIRGQWLGSIVYITLDFNLSDNFKDYYNIIEKKFPLIDKSNLLKLLPKGGFPGSDGREFNKINQWEKLQVFDHYFKKWKRVIYMDAGLRVLNSVKYLLEVKYENKIVVKFERTGGLAGSLYDDNNYIHKVYEDVKGDFENGPSFLNCMWIYDTSILDICDKDILVDGMNKYPICKHNEMTIMILYFIFKFDLWIPLPDKDSNGKPLFIWSDLDYPGTTWRDFCCIKYPVTIKTFKDNDFI